MTTALQTKFADGRATMKAALIERDTEIDLSLCAALCKQHLLLVGAPGTAKSMTVSMFGKWLNVKPFEYTMTKYTEPHEIFGPVDLMALTKEKKTRRLTDGFMPDAVFIFADETFRASSAIANTLLTLMNERIFRYGDQVFKVPLALMVGASNTYPHEFENGRELGAFFDRFLFRKTVDAVQTPKGVDRLLFANDKDFQPTFATTLSAKELDKAHAEAMNLDITDDAKQAFLEIRATLAREGVTPGDRRQRLAVKAAQAFAYLEGADEVEVEHLDILSHVLWDDPRDQAVKTAQIVARIANPTGFAIGNLYAEMRDIIKNFDPKDPSKSAAVVSKLKEIIKKAKALPKTPRVAEAIQEMDEACKNVRLAFVDAIG